MTLSELKDSILNQVLNTEEKNNQIGFDQIQIEDLNRDEIKNLILKIEEEQPDLFRTSTFKTGGILRPNKLYIKSFLDAGGFSKEEKELIESNQRKKDIEIKTLKQFTLTKIISIISIIISIAALLVAIFNN